MKLTIVIPVHNEEQNVPLVFDAVEKVMMTLPEIEWNMLFVDDGSTDSTMKAILNLSKTREHIQFVELSRNFGKEIATTAGLHQAYVSWEEHRHHTRVLNFAVILMDADLQHPPALIPTFVKKWKEGADMVIGLRKKNRGEGIIKKWGSCAFNKIMTRISDTEYIAQSTDFRLISGPVLEAFAECTERGRITRSLLDWLGFRKSYVEFEAAERAHGKASYSCGKLIKLAMSSFLSHSMFPLKFAGYLGLLIMFGSGSFGLFIFVEKYLTHDVLHMNFSGPAILAVINLFLIGLVLACLGLVALYVGNIHTETMNRPLYIVRSKKT